MGNICDTDIEDKGMQKVKHSVGTNSDSIGGDILNELLSLNPAKDNLKERVQLSISLSNLPNLDRKSKTDPYCVIF